MIYPHVDTSIELWLAAIADLSLDHQLDVVRWLCLNDKTLCNDPRYVAWVKGNYNAFIAKYGYGGAS